MTTKVCVSAWSGGPQKTKDAVTVGQLESLIEALRVFGYDIDTPVTFLFDDDHVWLETVEFEDENCAAPRSWQSLAEVPIVVKVQDTAGDIWEHHAVIGWRWRQPGSSTWRHEVTRTDFRGPYSEVI